MTLSLVQWSEACFIKQRKYHYQIATVPLIELHSPNQHFFLHCSRKRCLSSASGVCPRRNGSSGGSLGWWLVPTCHLVLMCSSAESQEFLNYSWDSLIWRANLTENGVSTDHLQLSPPQKVFFLIMIPLCSALDVSQSAGYALDRSTLLSLNRWEEAKNCRAGNGHLAQWAWPFKFISNTPPCFVFASANLLSPHKTV